MKVMLYVVVYDNNATQPSSEHILDTSGVDLFAWTEIQSAWSVIKEYDPQLADWLGAAATKLSNGDPYRKSLLLSGETIVTAVLLSRMLYEEIFSNETVPGKDFQQLTLWEDI